MLMPLRLFDLADSGSALIVLNELSKPSLLSFDKSTLTLATF